MGIILMYIAYMMLTTQLLRRRNEGWPGNLPDAQDGLFGLGSWAKLTNVVAILYGAAMIINLEWPREEFYGPLWYQKYGSDSRSRSLVFVIGLAIYHGGQKNKVGVLAEHQAEPAPAAGD